MSKKHYIKFKILEYRDKASDPASDAMNHPKVGTYGYQVIENYGTDTATCTSLVFDDGTPIPTTARMGYDLVDTNPPRPSWAPGKDDEEEIDLGSGS